MCFSKTSNGNYLKGSVADNNDRVLWLFGILSLLNNIFLKHFLSVLFCAPFQNGHTSLWLAAIGGHFELVSFLINRGVSKDSKDNVSS